MGPPREASWVRQHAETEVDAVEREGDGVEKEEVESRFFGNFPEGFRVKMGARPKSVGRFPGCPHVAPAGACRGFPFFPTAACRLHLQWCNGETRTDA